MRLFTLRILFLFSFFLPVLAASGQVVAGFTASQTAGCVPLIVAYTNTTTPATGTTYSWDMGNGTGLVALTNPGTTYFTAGTYTVTLTATNGGISNTHTQLITVYPSPVVHFAASDTLICPGAPDVFTNTTVAGVPGPLTYLWSFGDGYTSTAGTATHAYSFPGYFNITLNATNADGCPATLTKNAYVHVRVPPTPVFSATDTHICNPPADVVFTSVPVGDAPFSFNWTFGDGSLPESGANPVHLYTALGAYTVSLIVTDTHGCEDSSSVPGYITVSHLAADFTGPDSACINSTVYFINTSSPYLTRFWLYGDGTTDTSMNGHHTYTTGKLDTVKLVTYNGYCYDTAAHTIYIEAPLTSFTITPDEPCPAPVLATFATTVLPGSVVTWTFGDSLSGTGSATTHTYLSNSIDSVHMYVTTTLGCKDSALKVYNIYDLLYDMVDSIGFAFSGCIPLSMKLLPLVQTSIINPSPAPYPYGVASYLWNFGDGSPTSTAKEPNHTYTATGAYTLSSAIITNNGCHITADTPIRCGTPPWATFTAYPLHICAGDSEIQFNAHTLLGPIDSFSWNFMYFSPDTYGYPGSDSIALHHYSDPGTYSTQLVAYYNGCPDSGYTQIHDILVNPPSAKYVAAILCSTANTLQFTDRSEGDDTHTWLFGDGSSSTLADPVHTFSASGTYITTLITYNTTSGCTDSTEMYNNLYKTTVAFSTADSAICRDQYVIINSSVLTGEVNYYNWFTDGIAPYYNSYNLIDTFHTTGYHTIMLVIHDANLCPDTIIRTNYILVAKPVAHYTISPATICLPLYATFTNTSTDVPGTFVTNALWSFGDSTAMVSGLPTVNYLYGFPYAFITKMIVTDNLGCKDSTIMTANTYEPSASFTAGTTHPCMYIPVAFTNTSPPGLSSLWLFGDGGTSPLTSPTHTYTATGAYTVRLVVTDGHGCHDTATTTCTVTQPHAAFTMDDSVAICPPFSVHFTSASTGSSGLYWDFGNGDSSVSSVPTCIYTVPGYDTVKLVAVNTYGCTDTTGSQHVKVYGYPGAFTYNIDSGCVPFTVSFNADLDSVSGVSGITWDFSDGTITSPSLSDTISHIYLAPGGYLPKLIVNGHTGCVSSNLGLDTIRADGVKPGFTINPNPVCLGDTAILTDTSTALWSHITAWHWVYNDTSSNISSPLVAYNAAGIDTILLQATDSWGCAAVVSETVSVTSIPAITVAPDSVICTRATTMLSDADAGGVWSSSSITIATIGSGTGNVTGMAGGTAILTYELPTGCIATKTVTVNAFPDPGIITGSAGVCAGDTITYTDTAHGGTWSCGSNTAITPTGQLTGISPGTDTIIYTVANGNCDTAAIKIITIYPLPPIPVITGQGTVCMGATITLADSATGGKWISGNNAVATIDSNSGQVKAIALGTATITYTTPPNSNGCSNKTTFTIMVINPDFTATGNITQVKCYNDSDASIAIIIGGGNPPFRYLWSTGDTAGAIKGLDTGEYTVHITETTTQCNVTDTFIITQPDTLYITTDIKEDVCHSGVGSITTTVTGGTMPYSYLWSNKSIMDNITDVAAGTYELSLSDYNGCMKKITVTVPDTCDQIIIYNAVSPNGDGINDTWVILGLDLFPNNTVQVFDKWGDEIFSATNYKSDWGGTGKNGLLPDGTYYYLVKLNSSNPPDGKDSYTGSLLIKK